MPAKVTFKLDNLKKKVDKLSKKTLQLKVGFLDPKFAQIAVKNEFGGVYPISNEYRQRAIKAGFAHFATKKDIDIIPRPFMQFTVNEKSKEWGKSLIKLLQKNEPQQALSILGLVMQQDIQKTISNNNFERNPEPYASIKGRNAPLVDTGEMRRNVNFEVKTG